MPRIFIEARTLLKSRKFIIGNLFNEKKDKIQSKIES